MANIPESEKITPALLDALRRGDQQAFEAVYLRYVASLGEFLSALVRSSEVGSELTQDVFVTLWERRENIDPDKNISGYLYTIAKNHAFKFLNRRKNTPVREIEQADGVAESLDPPDRAMLAAELGQIVDQAVGRMPAQRRRIFELSRQQGLSNAEIALQLGISKSTVENHITSALKDLREVIGLMVALLFLM